jgi:hypothetical protein
MLIARVAFDRALMEPAPAARSGNRHVSIRAVHELVAALRRGLLPTPQLFAPWQIVVLRSSTCPRGEKRPRQFEAKNFKQFVVVMHRIRGWHHRAFGEKKLW